MNAFTYPNASYKFITLGFLHLLSVLTILSKECTTYFHHIVMHETISNRMVLVTQLFLIYCKGFDPATRTLTTD